jgi:hypothetical protein
MPEPPPVTIAIFESSRPTASSPYLGITRVT